MSGTNMMWESFFYPENSTEEEKEKIYQESRKKWIESHVLYEDLLKNFEKIPGAWMRSHPIRVWNDADGLMDYYVTETYIDGEWKKVTDKDLIIESLKECIFHLYRSLMAHGCKNPYRNGGCLEIHNEHLYGP